MADEGGFCTQQVRRRWREVGDDGFGKRLGQNASDMDEVVADSPQRARNGRRDGVTGQARCALAIGILHRLFHRCQSLPESRMFVRELERFTALDGVGLGLQQMFECASAHRPSG